MKVNNKTVNNIPIKFYNNNSQPTQYNLPNPPYKGLIADITRNAINTSLNYETFSNNIDNSNIIFDRRPLETDPNNAFVMRHNSLYNNLYNDNNPITYNVETFNTNPYDSVIHDISKYLLKNNIIDESLVRKTMNNLQTSSLNYYNTPNNYNKQQFINSLIELKKIIIKYNLDNYIMSGYATKMLQITKNIKQK